MKNKAIFLDRDGVINQEQGYISSWEDFHLLPDVIQALRIAKAADFKLIVVTNQSGIARGLYTEKKLYLIHSKLNQLLKLNGVEIDAFYYCPHHPQGVIETYRVNCECRKPLAGMLMQASIEHQIDLSASFLIGDSPRDIIAGRKASCVTYGVKTGHGFPPNEEMPDYLVNNILEAVQAIIT